MAQLRALTLALILFTTSAFTDEVPRRYVNSVVDLVAHMHAHIDRTLALSEYLFEHHAAAFGFDSADRNLVKDLIHLHDQSKVNSSKLFQQKFYRPQPDSRTIPERLFEVYGRQDLLSQRNAVVRDLNAIDQRVAQVYFERKGLLGADGEPNAKARSLLRFEKIVDLVDRGMDPVAREEFGRPLLRASEYLTDATDRKLAAQLEAYYSLLTRRPLRVPNCVGSREILRAIM